MSRLILSRRVGDAIRIGNDVVVTVIGFQGAQVRIGIRAPREVHVLRTELAPQAISEPREVVLPKIVHKPRKKEIAMTKEIPMRAFRYENQATSKNADALVELLQSPLTERVILYASAFAAAGMSQTDGPETNLPLLAALAAVRLPAIGTLQIVFDGPFLTCARLPRYDEVRHVLDCAEMNSKVECAMTPAPFTSALSPEAAVARLRDVGPTTTLTPDTRAGFFALLSRVPESFFLQEMGLLPTSNREAQ